MSAALAFALLLAPSTPSTRPFAARVAAGRHLESASTGPAYQQRLWARLEQPFTDALGQCLVEHASADKSPFTLVADVSPDGTPRQIDVQPATPVAHCLADWFARMALPPPPRVAALVRYPIEIDVSIVP